MNAPTGNTGIYARNVSGGIEPVFSKAGYYRWSIVPEIRKRELLAKGFKYADVTKGEWFETDNMKFSKRGDEQILKGSFDGRNYEIDKNRGLVVESYVEDYGIKQAKKIFGKDFESMDKAGAFASAQEISVDDHLAVLLVAAEFTNMSISKTVNVPNDYSYEEFKKVYIGAWKNNIKGITTYRDGTMTAVLETASKQKEKKNKNTLFEEHHAPKRPEELECDIYHMQVNGEKWNMFVGMFEDKPYEIFAGRAEYVDIPKSKKKGIIKKNGKYNLIIDKSTDNEIVIKDLAHVFENATESAFTRTLSLSMRHGVPVQFVVEQLQKGADKENNMFSLSKALMRCLKSYIQDGTKSTQKSCVECGSKEHLVYQEGCMVCKNCGNSKCN
jgi:ribonucleoside-diphosphate reductase alpha chain